MTTPEVAMLTASELKISEPCCEDWEAMDGDGQRRHCLLCEKDVVNLSMMTELEASRYLRETENSCIRYIFNRDDGQVYFVHPQVRRQRRGVKQMVAAAAMVMPLALGLAACEPDAGPGDDVEAVAQAPQFELQESSAESQMITAAQVEPGSARAPIVDLDGEAMIRLEDSSDADDDSIDDGDDSSNVDDDSSDADDDPIDDGDDEEIVIEKADEPDEVERPKPVRPTPNESDADRILMGLW